MMTPRVDIPAWRPPWPVDVKERFIRVSAAHLRGDERWECAEQVALKARPGIYAKSPDSVRVAYPPYRSFPLGLVRQAAYAVLAKGFDAEAALAQARDAQSYGDTVVADATMPVAQEGLTGYLIAIERLRDAGVLSSQSVVREFFAVDEAESEAVRVEWAAWGLLHVDPANGEREFHILTWDNAGLRARPDSYLAVYARVAADALMHHEDQRHRERREPGPHQPPPATRVRVREIGVLDSTEQLLIDVAPDDLRSAFPELIAPALPVLAGGSFNPGSRCAECTARNTCPALPRMPGVLGVAGSSTWTRALAPNDLTAARVCTWQVHLQRELSLPRARQETTAAMSRGSHLHAWLEHAHGRFIPCSEADVPMPGDGIGEVAERLGWTPEQYAALRPYLVAHQQGCPLHADDIAAVQPERSLTAWDTDADVIISTRADLVLDTSSGIVVRETKSLAEAPEESSTAELLERYPQVAVTLCLLADGLDPLTGEVTASSTPAVVQLEMIWPGGQVVRTFDAADPEVVLAARAMVAEAVDTIIYTEPTPNLGRWCNWCPVARWCTARNGSDLVEMAEEEVVASGGNQPSRVSLLAYAEDVSGAEDDLPF